MTRILVMALACVLILQFACGEDPPQGQFELREGKCKKATAADLVFIDNIHLGRLPFVTRTGTFNLDQTPLNIVIINEPGGHENGAAPSVWYGDETIYCILALSKKEEAKGSTVFIKEGGINHTHVTLEMHSTVNHGLEYNIQVYAKLKK